MSAPARQLPLDLGHRSASGREDFLIAPSNRDAVSWIDLWPEWPAPAFVLHGPPASGKSHLAAVWAQRSGALSITPDDLRNQDAGDLSAAAPALVIDGFDSCICDRAAETALFHLYNIAREHGRTLLVTMEAPPARQPFVLADLASRLRAAPAASIQPPDDSLLSSLLVKLFADRQLQVGSDVIAYILPRIERSFAAARDLVTRADAQALAERRNISIPLLRALLESAES